MCVEYLWLCKCDCHGPRKSGVHHLVPCCRVCERCGLRIKPGFISDHAEECEGKND